MNTKSITLRPATLGALALAIFSALFLMLGFTQSVYAVQSPPGCTADNSTVNISSDIAQAEEGDVITFVVEAGNPASADGCDIENREITLTLPDGTMSSIGPSNYPNPTALSDVISEQYVADLGDLDGGVWNATVEWDGILKNVSDIPSNGDKGAAVFPLYPLVVEKTVDTSYDRDWDWDIEKVVVGEDDLLLAEGETYTVDYEVTVTPSSDDINHTVSGVITVTNPAENQGDATVVSVNDVLDVSGVASVTSCEDEDDDTTAPWTLSPGESMTCDYVQAGASPDDTENTATVVVSGDIPAGDGVTEDVVYGNPENETDECVDVNDDVYGYLGEVCADDVDMTLEYSWTFGPADGVDIDTIVGCDDDFDWPNTAEFETNDTQTTDTDDANVHVQVDCFQGCTLTQGYWKTHSEQGPAPWDMNWDEHPVPLPNAEETTFFLSEMSWLDVFWTPPSGGNAYYQLAHQWMAAKLNELNGTSVPANVAEAITDGETLFSLHEPDELVGYAKTNKKGKNVGKKEILLPDEWDEMKEYASTLASYNEGDIGPGHCDEDESSQVD